MLNVRKNPSALLYAAFDAVPGPKGAAVHIEQFARGIATEFGHLQLATISQDGHLRTSALSPQIEQVEIPAPGDDVITRVMNFRRMMSAWMNNRRFDVIQIRSPYEGFWIARDKSRYCKALIYEVNGLPSVELKYRYPKVADDNILLSKLFAQEQLCLDAADLVVTTCAVSERYLVSRGVPNGKIAVIPNGVQTDVFEFCPEMVPLGDEETFKLIYFGTLSPWQGIEFALRVVAALITEMSVHLTVVGPGSDHQFRALSELANKLGILQRVRILGPMPQRELVSEIHKAHAIIAPLTANDRNLEQGCCPLKVLEGMSSGRPVVASDLEVVREIAGSGTAILAKCGSVQTWKAALILLRHNYQQARGMTIEARKTIENSFSWHRACEQLNAHYRSILSSGETVSVNS